MLGNPEDPEFWRSGLKRILKRIYGAVLGAVIPVRLATQTRDRATRGCGLTYGEQNMAVVSANSLSLFNRRRESLAKQDH